MIGSESKSFLIIIIISFLFFLLLHRQYRFHHQAFSEILEQYMISTLLRVGADPSRIPGSAFGEEDGDDCN